MSEPRGHLVAIGALVGRARRAAHDPPAAAAASAPRSSSRSTGRPESHPTAFRDPCSEPSRCCSCAKAEDKDELESGTVYVAAPDYHLLVDGERLALRPKARPACTAVDRRAARDRCRELPRSLRRGRPHGANDDSARSRGWSSSAASRSQDPHAVRTEMPTRRCSRRRTRASRRLRNRRRDRRALRRKDDCLMASSLLVDDAPRTPLTLKAILEPLGHELVTSASATTRCACCCAEMTSP